MRKRSLNLVRTRGKRVLNSYNRMVRHFAYAQLSQRWAEWTFRTISERQALQLVAAGEAIAITRQVDGIVQTVGYQAITPTSWELPSPATLTLATTNAVANAVGIAPKLTRRERDEIFKFKVWALIGDTKAVAVRPRISDADRAEAEKLLATPESARLLKLHAAAYSYAQPVAQAA